MSSTEEPNLTPTVTEQPTTRTAGRRARPRVFAFRVLSEHGAVLTEEPIKAKNPFDAAQRWATAYNEATRELPDADLARPGSPGMLLKVLRVLDADEPDSKPTRVRLFAHPTWSFSTVDDPEEGSALDEGFDDGRGMKPAARPEDDEYMKGYRLGRKQVTNVTRNASAE